MQVVLNVQADLPKLSPARCVLRQAILLHELCRNFLADVGHHNSNQLGIIATYSLLLVLAAFTCRKLAITLCALETDAAAVDVISPALAHENPGDTPTSHPLVFSSAASVFSN